MSYSKPARRLSRRIFRAFALMLLAASTVFTATFLYAQRQQMEADLLARGRALAMLLASGARIAVFAENPELIQDSLQGALDHEEVLSAAVFTSDRTALAAAGRTPAHKERAALLTPAMAKLVGGARLEGGCADLRSEGRIEVFCPVLIRKATAAGEDLYFVAPAAPAAREVAGFARLTIDRGPMRRALAALMLRGALLAALLLLAGTAGVFFLSRRVTEPLERLTEAVRTFGTEGAIRPLPDASDDEIRRLAAAFVTMTQDLEAREREKELLAERLRHAQKMEAVGRLSQGVAHDFKNLLSTLKTGVYLLRKGAPENEFVLTYTGRLENTLERARELVERLVAFSRTRELQLGVVDLAVILERVAPTFREVLGERARLALEIQSRPVHVLGNAASLEQLLANLIYNARDAMPEGGIACIRLGVREAGAGGAPAARLEVRDTGVGMAPGVRSRVFEPFFTTKDSGAGMGLGLSIVRGIVEEHRGQIELDSEPGEGTTFTVELPLVRDPEAPGAAGEVAGAA